MADPFVLARFVDAQAASYSQALTEIRQGRKRTHWMWFIFPQIAGLGTTPMSRHFAIGSLDEARAYVAHPVLGERYREAVSALQDLAGTTAEEVFGPIDAIKLRSSLTLFGQVVHWPGIGVLIDRWYGGVPDSKTLELIGRASDAAGS